MDCRVCRSSNVVRLGSYERCLECHACFADGVRISDTPECFRVKNLDEVRAEVVANRLFKEGVFDAL